MRSSRFVRYANCIHQFILRSLSTTSDLSLHSLWTSYKFDEIETWKLRLESMNIKARPDLWKHLYGRSILASIFLKKWNDFMISTMDSPMEVRFLFEEPSIIGPLLVPCITSTKTKKKTIQTACVFSIQKCEKKNNPKFNRSFKRYIGISCIIISYIII